MLSQEFFSRRKSSTDCASHLFLRYPGIIPGNLKKYKKVLDKKSCIVYHEYGKHRLCLLINLGG